MAKLFILKLFMLSLGCWGGNQVIDQHMLAPAARQADTAQELHGLAALRVLTLHPHFGW